MAMRVDASARAAATEAVSRGAQAAGADFALLLETAKRESGLDRTARAGASSAAGLFQFVDGTWMSLMKRYGARHGVALDASDPAQRQAVLNLRYDPELAATMAGELTRENARVLEAKLGRAASHDELYAAHVLGPSGAARLIHAAESCQETSAAALLPAAAAANHGIFFDRDGDARAPAAVLAKLSLGPPPPVASAPAPVEAAVVSSEPPSEGSARAGTFSAALSELLHPQDWLDAGADLWALAMRAYRGGRET